MLPTDDTTAKRAEKGKANPVQPPPGISIEPPPGTNDLPTSRAENPRIRPPSPNPPSQTSKTPPPNAGGKKDSISPGLNRPRANSTGSSESTEARASLLDRIAQGVRYLNRDEFGRNHPTLDTTNDGGTKRTGNEFGIGLGKTLGRGGGNAGAGARGRGRGGRGRGGQGRGGKGDGNQPHRSKSQENLTVPGPNKTDPKSGKDRASSVPRHHVVRGPPLFDVQRDSGTPHKRVLANRWFQNLERFTEPLISNYADSKYEKVRIAVLDTGVEKSTRRTTPEFMRQHGQQIKGGRSFLGNDSNKCPWNKDSNGHGTHVTGLLLRVAPRAEIYVARILRGWESTIDPKNVEEALKCCIDEWNVDIITMSFGFHKEHSGIEDQLNRAVAKRILVFAAASNDGTSKTNNIAWPARDRNVFCIFSATGEGENSSFNPPPPRLGFKFATLGEEVESDWPIPLLTEKEKEDGFSTARKSGTSFATPIAAAISALVLEFARQPPTSGNPEVAHQLKKLDRMEGVFERMSKRTVAGYDYVYPWLLFHASEMGRGTNPGDANDRYSARGMVEGELVRIVSQHVKIFRD